MWFVYFIVSPEQTNRLINRESKAMRQINGIRPDCLNALQLFPTAT
jgi:hypothetical protein